MICLLVKILIEFNPHLCLHNDDVKCQMSYDKSSIDRAEKCVKNNRTIMDSVVFKKQALEF